MCTAARQSPHVGACLYCLHVRVWRLSPRRVGTSERGSMLRDVLARATPAGLSDTSIGVYARLRPGGEAGTEVEVKRKAGEQRHIQVLLTPGARIAIARMLAAA